MGLTVWHRAYLESLPVAKMSETMEADVCVAVDHILAAKEANPDADTSELEAEIDRLVYDLYGLTEEEIAAVESRLSV